MILKFSIRLKSGLFGGQIIRLFSSKSQSTIAWCTEETYPAETLMIYSLKNACLLIRDFKSTFRYFLWANNLIFFYASLKH